MSPSLPSPPRPTESRGGATGRQDSRGDDERQPAAPHRPLDRGAPGAPPGPGLPRRRRPRLLRRLRDHHPRVARPPGAGAARHPGDGDRDRPGPRAHRAGGDARRPSSSRSAASRLRCPTVDGRASCRALNVLRQYDESEVAAAWATMRARLARADSSSRERATRSAASRRGWASALPAPSRSRSRCDSRGSRCRRSSRSDCRRC